MRATLSLEVVGASTNWNEIVSAEDSPPAGTRAMGYDPVRHRAVEVTDDEDGEGLAVYASSLELGQERWSRLDEIDFAPSTRGELLWDDGPRRHRRSSAAARDPAGPSRPGRSPAPARFLLLGSGFAGPDLVRGSAESLAGRVAFVEMSGFDLLEAGVENGRRLWLRGGLPRSYLARSEAISLAWRRDFVRTFDTRLPSPARDARPSLEEPIARGGPRNGSVQRRLSGRARSPVRITASGTTRRLRPNAYSLGDLGSGVMALELGGP